MPTGDPYVTFFTELFCEPRAIYDAIPLVRAEDFWQDDYRHTYAAMVELSQESKPIDMAHVSLKLEARGYSPSNACDLLCRLLDGGPVPGQIKHYAALVRKASHKRRLLALLEAGLTRGQQGEAVEEIIADLQREFWELQSDRPQSGPVAAREFAPEFAERAYLERQQSFETEAVSTAVPLLDAKTTGIRPGELWSVGALPGRGKTSFALQVARKAVNRGTPTLIFSVEMTRHEISRRWLAAEFGVRSMRSLHEVSGKQWQEIVASTAELRSLPLYIDDAPSPSAQDIAARARTAIREHGIKLIIVDYLQLVRGHEREIRERVGNTANVLRALAKETQVPVIELSQLRRPGNLNDRPTMLDLKESGDIEAHSHTVLLIYQPVGSDGCFSGHDEIIIGKQRNGPLGTVPVRFDQHALDFRARELYAVPPSSDGPENSFWS